MSLRNLKIMYCEEIFIKILNQIIYMISIILEMDVHISPKKDVMDSACLHESLAKEKKIPLKHLEIYYSNFFTIFYVNFKYKIINVF